MSFTPPPLPSQPVLGTGLTSVSPTLLPNTAATLHHPTPVQPTYGMNNAYSLTNQMSSPGLVTPPRAFPSTMSPAQGISPLPSIGPALPASPVTPGQLTSLSPAVRPVQPLVSPSRPVAILQPPLTPLRVLNQNAMPSAQPLLQPLPLQPAPAQLVQPRPMVGAAYSAVPMQPVHGVMQPAVVPVAQQPALLQATPIYQPSHPVPLALQHPPTAGVFVQSPPQQYQVTPMSQVLISPQPAAPVLVSNSPMPGTMLVQGPGML